MFSIGFDTLRTKHPDQQGLVSRLQSELERMFMKNAEAVVDEHLLGQRVHEDARAIRALLVELVGLGFLETRFIWLCPTAGGGAMEAADLSQFPDRLECPLCGQEHWFSANDVEVRFAHASSSPIKPTKF